MIIPPDPQQLKGLIIYLLIITILAIAMVGIKRKHKRDSRDPNDYFNTDN